MTLTDHVPVAKLSVGFCTVGEPAKFTQPLPEFFSHSQEVGVFVLASVNTTEREVEPERGAPVKSATGAAAPMVPHPELPPPSVAAVATNVAPPVAVELVRVQPLGAVTVPLATDSMPPVIAVQPVSTTLVAVVVVPVSTISPLAVNVVNVLSPLKVVPLPPVVSAAKVSPPPAKVFWVLPSLITMVEFVGVSVRFVAVLVFQTVPVPVRVIVALVRLSVRRVALLLTNDAQ